ncbi:MAG TPA: ABC transporter permease [Burkholderiales bacterium]|nr:ABC transporter permease [Burkholderiales bacterium]
MRWHPILAIVLRQFYLMRGSPARLFPLVMWVAVDILLWGFITKFLATVAEPGFNFVSTLLGAVLLWDFFGRVMLGVTTAFFEDVWSRNFLNVFATPLRISEYVAGLVLTSILSSSLALAVMIALASAVFGLSIFAYGALLAPFLLVLFLSGIALGIFGAAVVLRLGPAAEWLIWPVPALLSPFVGVFYPLATLPAWMQIIAHALAPSYVFEGMRAIIAGEAFPATHLLWSTGLAAIYILLAAFFFARVYRHAVRTGLLARYSAETVS